ncbi:MAG: 7-carboxy-7-deazaguanine synthase QueE [Phycisphaerales bacterium]
MSIEPPIPISETFRSIQGEGRLTGVPSHFVRFSGCNLRCRWCDTPYASWAPESTPRTARTIIDEVIAGGCGHAVLTGGEPMMFDAIGPVSRALAEAGIHVTVETAGTIHRGSDTMHCDLMSLSPKLSGSTPRAGDPRDPDGRWRERHEARRLNHEVLQRLLDDWPDRQLKFVVEAPSDLDEIDALLGALTGWHPTDVQLMPEGVQSPDPDAIAWVVDACMDRGWRLCHRLHIELFGDTRGT